MMDNWVKLISYDRIDEASLRKDLLQQKDIKSNIINKKDSAFLFGDVELYVNQDTYERALEIIKEFEGWKRIDSYYNKKQILTLQNRLTEMDIDSQIIERKSIDSIFDVAELYVRNEQFEKARQFLDSPVGWEKIASFEKAMQAIYRTNNLDEHDIPSIVINVRDENLELMHVNIFVRQEDKDSAVSVMNVFTGWVELTSCENRDESEKIQELLNKKWIDVVEKRQETSPEAKFVLLVKEEAFDDAKAVLESSITWTELLTCKNTVESAFYSDVLRQNDIDSAEISTKDSSFLIGDIKIYVEEKDLSKAGQIIENLQKEQ
jgi:hypothetical protein